MKRLPPWVSIPLILAAAAMHGCDSAAPKKPVATVPPPPSPPDPPPVPAPSQAVAVQPAPTPSAPPSPPAPPPSVVPPPPALPSDNTPATPVVETPPSDPNSEAVKPGVGVGIKGRSLDEHEGALVTPAKAYFAVREKAVFQIQIPAALQLYQAEHGELPKTHAEFMEKIVEPNLIKLPELPQGHRYEFNGETGELMVLRPKK